MAILDRFIKHMFDSGGSSVQLLSNQQVVLHVSGKAKPITRDKVPTSKILGLVKEVMPEWLHEELDKGEGRVTFAYVSDDKRVNVEAEHSQSTAFVLIKPATRREASPSVAIPAESIPREDETPVAAPKPKRETRPSRSPVTAAYAGEERIQKLLRHIVDSDSSDLHLRVGLPPTYRTHGELVPLEGAEPLGRDDIEQMLQAIMPERNRQEFEETNDTDFAYEILNLARFRANALMDRVGPAAVFRVIPAEILTADQLGLSPEVQKLCYLTKGLVVVTGPTGSGKSTTLAGMIDLINRTRTDHIITIEDPIEFVHPNKKCIVTQRQVGSHTQGFKRALRAALREDPDIILIGEMRDLETVAIAIETAETGHLVFGTLHTTTAVSTVDRIIDQFPADRQDQIRVMLSESLKGVIAQVLLKKKGGGRVAAREILLSIGAVSNLIREAKTFQLPSIIQTNKKLGMATLNDSLLELIDKDQVTPEEAYMKSADKSGLETSLQQRGKRLDMKGHDELG